MLAHDLRLALQSFRRNPVLTALMVGAIAAGIGASMITLTLYHARAGHPIGWKEDRLFAVALDNRSIDPKNDRMQRHPEYPPPQLTWRDARALYRSDIPVRSLMMYITERILDPQRNGMKPFGVTARVTTADFFPMFDVPFRYGGGWARAGDDASEPVAVISGYLNGKLFNGTNSVGRSLKLSGREYRIVGVLDAWRPEPRFYDVNGEGFQLPDDVYIPFGWSSTLRLMSYGNLNCVTDNAKIDSFDSLLTADCDWLQFWVQMDSADQVRRYRQFVDNYVLQEKRHGRFERPLNNRVLNVQDWLAMNDVVGDDSRLELMLAMAFLVVCILNTIGLMLAKFIGSAPVTGLRRALGASRRDIMRQHLTEVMVMGLAGGAIGTALAWFGLLAIRVLTYVPAEDNEAGNLAMAQSLAHMDYKMVVAAVLIALVTGGLAGLYPAWRVGRLAPAMFLKSQ